MAQRPQGCKSEVMAADGYVTEANLKNVYALVVATDGATAGDVVVLRDGGPTGTIRVMVNVFNAIDTKSIPLGRYGVCFVNDIYYSEQASAAGKIRTTVVWD